MVGEGGMPLHEWRRLKDMHLCLSFMRGVARRYRAVWETTRIHIRAIASMMGCKNIPSDYPYTLPWHVDNDNQPLSDEDQERCMQDAEALFSMTFNKPKDG